MDQETLQKIAALSAAGKSTRQIEAVVGADHSTIARWQNRDEVRRRIDELRPAIAARLAEHMWNLVDQENLHLKTKPVELATLYGIAMDKDIKAQQVAHPAQDNRQLIIVIPGLEPQAVSVPTIEGEVSDQAPSQATQSGTAKRGNQAI